MFRAFLRIGSAAACTIATPTGSRGPACCTRSTRRKSTRESDEKKTPGYTLVSAELSYTTKLDHRTGGTTEMTIGIKGENLADDDVLNHASFKRRDEEVYLPGASVRVFGKLKFN